ncbi:MAG: hypothetical protein WC332_00050 [Clostridia bacterium]|jgi:hypothetical protein
MNIINSGVYDASKGTAEDIILTEDNNPIATEDGEHIIEEDTE